MAPHFLTSLLAGQGFDKGFENRFWGRWKLWALFCFVFLVASIGTYITGQYKITRLDVLKNRYDEPVTNFARYFDEADNVSIERDLLDGCKQAQIGSWLQTTDALHFDGPLTGNRVQVRLNPEQAYVDLNGGEIAGCVRDEVADRQFDIGSMTTTWAALLLLVSICLGGWAWICRQHSVNAQKSRNIYAEALQNGGEEEVVHADENSPASDIDKVE